MNKETEINESNKPDTLLSSTLTFIEYALNRFMPTLCVAFISIYSFGYATWEPYAILGFMIFSNSFNFKCGYAHCELDKTNWED